MGILVSVFPTRGGIFAMGPLGKRNSSLNFQFKCCGALRFEDWLVSEWHKDEDVLKDGSLVPDSCCKTSTHLCGRRDHPSNIHYTVHADFNPFSPDKSCYHFTRRPFMEPPFQAETRACCFRFNSLRATENNRAFQWVHKFDRRNLIV